MSTYRSLAEMKGWAEPEKKVEKVTTGGNLVITEDSAQILHFPTGTS